jgi:hypothetical protein
MFKQNYFFTLFFLIMLGASPLVFCAPDPMASSPDAAGSPASPQAVTEPVSGIDTAIQKSQEEIRDPFAITAETKAAVTAAPADAAAAEAPVVAVVLEGIGFGVKDAYALIGGDVYYLGDEKNGIKLVEVRRREVDVLVNGGMMTVPLFPKEDLEKMRDRAEKKVAAKNQTEVPASGEDTSEPLIEEQQFSELPVPLPNAEGDELPS